MATRTLVLQPGEKVQLPANVNVVSIGVEPGAVLTTECTGLPEAEEYACYKLAFAVSDDLSGDAALGDEASARPTLETILIGGTPYEINFEIPNVPDGGASSVAEAVAQALKDAIEAVVPTSIFNGFNYYVDPFENRTEYVIRFYTLPSLIENFGIMVFISGIGFPDGLAVLPVSADCECESPAGDAGQVCDLIA